MRSVLVICMRRIGDVLLATPVAASIKAAWPGARIDMLVFAGTEAVLRGNPDLNEVIAVPEGLGAWETLALGARLWRRYDVAISVQPGDRPTFLAWAAGRRSIGFAEPGGQSAWKRAALDDAVPFGPPSEHTIAGNLRLLAPLGVAPAAAMRMHWDDDAPRRARAAFPGVDSAPSFAVMHVSPKFPYKAWTSRGWVELAQWLAQRGTTVVIAGGGSQDERDYIAGLVPQLPAGTVNVAGAVDLAALAWLIAKADIYIGTDTAVTHMAAALGTPAVALFGPSSPVKWGPWPRSLAAGPATPWLLRGMQQRGNVVLLQGEGDCVPCLGEGCEKHVRSLSDCLQEMPARRVIDSVERLLGGAHRRAHITTPS
jgi:heptosyltransferase III